MPDVRRGMPSRKLDRVAFSRRFKSRFQDPAFRPLDQAIDALADAAWDAYADSRKAPLTRKAGPGFADPDYELATDWLAARDAIQEAQSRHDLSNRRPNILLINGSSRTEHTCPGEMSKSWRLIELARDTITALGDFGITVLDLSRVTSEYGSPFTPANHASPRPWRSVTGRAAATRIIRSAKSMTG